MALRRLVRHLGALGLWVLLLLLPGCFKFEAVYEVHEDGSGTVTIRNVVDMPRVDAITALYKVMQGLSDSAEDKVPGRSTFEQYMDPDKLRTLMAKKQGVELVAASRADEPVTKARTLDAKFAFASLEDYYRSGLERCMEVEMSRGESGTWILKRTLVHPLADASGQLNRDAENKTKLVETLLRPHAKDFQIVVRFRAQGVSAAADSPGSESDGAVAWTVDYDALIDRKPHVYTVVFKGDGAGFRPFHVRIDVKGNVSDVLPPGATPPASTEGVAPETPPKEPADLPPAKEPAKEPAEPAAPR